MKREAMRDALGILVSIDSSDTEGYEIVASRKVDRDVYELVLARPSGKGRKANGAQGASSNGASVVPAAPESVVVSDGGRQQPTAVTPATSEASPISATWVVKSPQSVVVEESSNAGAAAVVPTLVEPPASTPAATEIPTDLAPPIVETPVAPIAPPPVVAVTPEPLVAAPVVEAAPASLSDAATTVDASDAAARTESAPSPVEATPVVSDLSADPTPAPVQAPTSLSDDEPGPASTPQSDLVRDDTNDISRQRTTGGPSTPDQLMSEDATAVGPVDLGAHSTAAPVVRVAPRVVTPQPASPTTPKPRSSAPPAPPAETKRRPFAREPKPESAPAESPKEKGTKKPDPAAESPHHGRRLPFSRAKDTPKSSTRTPPAPAPIRPPTTTRPRVEIDPKTGRPIQDPNSPIVDARSRVVAAPDPATPIVDASKASSRRNRPNRSEDTSGAPVEPRVPNEFQTFLVQSGRLTSDQLDEAHVRSVHEKIHLFEALDDLGYMTEAEMAAEVSKFYGLPVSDLKLEQIEPLALDLVPERVARTQMAFPVSLSPEGIFVVVAEPSERLAGLLAQASGQTVTMAIAMPSDIHWAIDSHYHALAGVAELVEEFEAGEGAQRRQATSNVTDLAAESAPIVQVVNRILSQAMRDGASDVHIEPADDIVRVRNRVDGVLKVVLVLPAAMGLGLVSRIKIMADMNIVERRRPQDGKFTVMIEGREVDVRVATVATIWGETCVMRILDKSRSVIGIDELGMTTRTHDAYSKLIRSPFGMVLCVGPTGSGKTTTLYASLTEISDVARNVMTIEDPVEYVFPSINQIQTNEQAGLTFATGLKSILRQDSDVVLVGEIRDVETARIAVQSTLTGHFVLSSLHATDAISGLTRFIDMGIESFLIASAVIGIVGQRLVRRICDLCKVPYTPSDEEMAFYVKGGGPAKDVFYHGAGCNVCGHTGFKNRVGVYELFPMTQEMKRLIVGFATEDELRDLARKQGMRSIQDEAISLIAGDMTTSAEVVRSIYSF